MNQIFWDIGKRKLSFENSPSVMGILNVTPDSFSDGGKHLRTADAVSAALKMEDHGAAIVNHVYWGKPLLFPVCIVEEKAVALRSFL